MLIPKIQATSSPDASSIGVQSLTGSYSPYNPGGWGNPNPLISDATKLYITVSRWGDDIVHRELFDGTELTNILLGDTVQIDSYVLGITEPSEGIRPFADSVYDVNEYVFVGAFGGVAGTLGDPFIVGQGMSLIIAQNDSILVGEEIYNIDKSKPDNGGAVLYLDRPLKSSLTEFNPGYRANVKVLVNAGAIQGRKLLAGKMADRCNPCYEQDKENALDVQVFLQSASDLFEDGDFEGANDLINHAYRLTKCKCLAQ